MGLYDEARARPPCLTNDRRRRATPGSGFAYDGNRPAYEKNSDLPICGRGVEGHDAFHGDTSLDLRLDPRYRTRSRA